MNGLLFCCLTGSYLLIVHLSIVTEGGDIGVNYGMVGDNLPPPAQVVSLLKSRNLTRVRLFNPNPDALEALENSGIQVTLGTLNQDLQRLGTDMSFAMEWVQENVLPYSKTVQFRYISAGNEVIPGDLSAFVFPAMKNLDSALKASNLTNIPVSTTVSTAVLGASYPPSRGEFSRDVINNMRLIATFLESNKSPLLVNIYPYFAYINNQQDILLSYALFNSTQVVHIGSGSTTKSFKLIVVVMDGNLGYTNIFDAMVDAVYSALDRAGGSSVEVVVSESGWPSDGNGDVATIPNAEMYNNRYVAHVLGSSGTPKRPGSGLEAYVFAIFNENMKPAGTEQNFGLYYPNMTQVYHVDFNQTQSTS